MDSPHHFTVTVITPAKTVFHGPAVSLIAPGQEGYLGILVNHAPILSILDPGKVTVRKESGETLEVNSLKGGFLEVSKNRATLLLDAVAADSL